MVTPVSNVDISDKKIGDTITLYCEVETCLTDIRVSFYKGHDLVHSISSLRNRQLYVYKHQVLENSAGNYSYRVSSRLASTPLLTFSITGDWFVIGRRGDREILYHFFSQSQHFLFRIAQVLHFPATKRQKN